MDFGKAYDPSCPSCMLAVSYTHLANVEYPAVVTAEQTFAAPNSGLYLPGMNRVRVLLEHRRWSYDADNPVGRTLL